MLWGVKMTQKKKISKPKKITFWDGSAECQTESYAFNEAFGVQVDGFLYDAKSTRRLIKFLEKAEQWLEMKQRSTAPPRK